MKMINTPTAVAANTFPAYIHNCLRNAACEPAYLAPIPAVPYLQLYVNFGPYKPATTEFVIVDICNNTTEQIFPSNYVVGLDPDGNWYGVFKYFNSPAVQPTSFVVWMSALVDTPAGFVERTFFSEAIMVDPCADLTKIKACHPEGATTTGFDINGLYYGLPTTAEYLGLEGVRYFHIAWVRIGKVREMSNKATFKSSLIRTFRSTIEKIHQLETELVPKWYKNVLLAIYSRGAISVNDGAAYIVSDLNFEALNDDDLTWKPFAQLKETFRLYFGCDDSECMECCSPVVLNATVVSEGGDSESDTSGSDSGGECVPAAIVPDTIPDAIVGTPYVFSLALTGTAPFVLGSVTKPAWLTLTIVGSTIQFTGTPTEAGADDLFITVTNCGGASESDPIAATMTTNWDCTRYRVDHSPEISIEWEDCATGSILSTTQNSGGPGYYCARTGTMTQTGGSGTITPEDFCTS